MRDSAASHHTKATQQFLRENRRGLAADDWASRSPDLNP